MKAFSVLILTSLLSTAVFAQLESASVNTEVPRAKEMFQGLRAFKPVLPGVLYRGGGSGGAIPLKQGQVEALCKKGFSNAGYLYPNGMAAAKTVTCTTDQGQENSIRYAVYGFRPKQDRYNALKAIYNIIKNKSGPMFMHCWNGWHASGEISALALMQFCDWSGAKAGEYWKANVGDKGNLPRYRSIYENHVGNFQPFNDLKISAEDQARVCPRD